MSIEEIIESLDNHASMLDNMSRHQAKTGKSSMADVCRAAIALLRTHPDARPNGWISVKERLPEPIVDVLALHRDDMTGEPYICIEWVDHEKEWIFNHRGPVTHWMPLPKPPKED